MFSDEEKYKNLLTQLHELNRNIMLNENEKVEQITQKINNIEEKIENNNSNSLNNENNKKFFIAIIIILLFNTLLLLFISFTSDSNGGSSKLDEKPKEEIVIENLVEEKPKNTTVIESKIEDTFEEKSTDDILSFKDQSIVAFEEDKNYQEIKPIIRKGTQYTCKGEEDIFKIPYTVEIKGKLYSNRFEFILQVNSITKECTILKEFM